MFNRAAYWNSRPGGFGVLEVVGDEAARQFVPLRRTAVGGEVAGPLAALRVTHTYGYSRAECDKVLEAVYRFPLPGDAAVTGVVVRFGEVEIRAELQEREQAEATYEEAKAQGQQAALATRESPDVFTLRVAGLVPDQEITVETSYVQLARPEGAGWSLRIPLTTAPRYVREDERGSRHAAGQPLGVLRDPGHRFALDLTIREAGDVASPMHPLALSSDDDTVRVRLRDGEVLPDRDCVLTWRPWQEASRPTLHLLLHDDRERDQVYFLALIAPPAAPDERHTVPREVVLLVDHSGSMSGPKWEAADWATKSFLAGLTERDAFALGVFHNTAQWYAGETRQSTPEAVERAIAFLLAARDSGGTNLGVALEQALDLPRAPRGEARHALIVTDAEVSDADRVLRLADQEAARGERRRISVLCIDAAPNAFLASELAERGGGVARFLTSAPEEEDITTALDEVLADWSAPVLAGLRLEVNRPDAEAGSGTVRASEPGWSALDLGDLPTSRAVWVVGRVPRGTSSDLQFRLAANRDPGVPTVRLSLHETPPSLPALKALFGARRVLGIEFLLGAGYGRDQLRDQLRRLGYDPDRALAGQSTLPGRVYAENAREDTSKALRQLLVAEALHYGLASAETAFVAVRREAGERVEGTVAVSNALPAGWSPTFAGGAASARMLTFAAMPMAPLPAMAPPPIAAPPPGGFGPTPPFQRRLRSQSPLSRLTDAVKSMLGGGEETPADAAVAPVQAGPPPSPAPASMPARERTTVVFSGVPQFTDGEAILFDSSRRDAALPAFGATIARLVVRFASGTSAPGQIDPGLTVQIFVDDLSAPRARVRLADLVRQGGERPLNLAWRQGQVLRVVLVDPAGAWAQGGLGIEVALG